MNHISKIVDRYLEAKEESVSESDIKQISSRLEEIIKSLKNESISDISATVLQRALKSLAYQIESALSELKSRSWQRPA